MVYRLHAKIRIKDKILVLSEKYTNEETEHEGLPVEMIGNCIKIRFRILC